MNVNHVEGVREYPDRILHAIFDKQSGVMGKYHEIEKNNGLLQTEMFPFNLHDRFCQARIKDFLWRTTEELAESLEVIVCPSEEFGQDHIIEEIIDALHFHTENCIQCGITADDILGGLTLEQLEEELTKDLLLDADNPQVMQERLFLRTIVSLGLSGNCLKNKPWKQDHKMTDVLKFKNLMKDAYYGLLVLMFIGFDMTINEVYDMYFRKNEVNKFRQRSGY